MAAQKCTCPECNLTFPVPAAASARVTCPICDTVFPWPTAGASVTSIVTASLLQPPQPTVSVPLRQPPADVTDTGRGARQLLNRSQKLALAGVAGLFVCLGGGSIAAYLWQQSPKPTVTAGPPPNSTPLPSVLPPNPLPAPVVLTEQQVKVNQAIDRGVAYLKPQLEAFNDDRVTGASAQQYYEGIISMMGLTLLECGVPANDPLIQRAAARLRARRPFLQTYSISLSLLFLDRLGDPQDRGRIQTLALRLLTGQTLAGNWGYTCFELTPPEEQVFLDFLKSMTYDPANKLIYREQPGAANALPSKLRNLPVVQNHLDPQARRDGKGDNSNTQFAVLALWVAQRHGLPMQPALALIDRYFRELQNPEGSWGYVGRSQQWRASMTCAGLLGLAVTRSLVGRPAAGQLLTRDPAIENGFRFLSESIQPAARGNGKGKYFGADAWGDLYYLWSLERVAMVYDLKMIGGKDWYAWASEVIVANQQADGSWVDNFPVQIDTCFALLVLKRVNVVQDLTANIKDLVIKEHLQGGAR